MKLITKSVLLASLCLILIQKGHTQESAGIKRSPDGRVKIIKGSSAKTTAQEPIARAEGLLSKHSTTLGLADSLRELKLEAHSQDELGINHLAYQQLYKDIPVFGAKARVHLKLDGSELTQADLVPNLNLNVVAKISPSQANALALKYVQSLKPELTTLHVKENATLTILSATLVRHSAQEKNLLAYLVRVSAKHTATNLQVFVNALSGEVVHSIALAHDTISRQVYDCSPGDNPNCYLNRVDSRYPNYILGRSESQPARGINPRYNKADTDIIYDLVGTAHSYFEHTHGRNGANMRGGLGDGISYPSSLSVAYSFIDPLVSFCPNAFWDGEGALAACAGLTTPDILGHEYAHAVTRYSADLIYQDEPGALNESISDIFGEAIERKIKGSNDWLLGAGSSIGTMRSMKEPASIQNSLPRQPYPDRFYSNNFYCGYEDNGGVHHNSSVLNHAAYLMAMGGNFNGCSIKGIGQDKQEAIIYRALTNYLSLISGFNDAYESIVQACSDLYSPADCDEVTKALRAVEMDQAGKCSGMPAQAPNCTTLLPTQENAKVTSVTLSKKVIKKAKKRTRYSIAGRVLNGSAQGIEGKALKLSCFSNKKPLSLDMTSFEAGDFSATVSVKSGVVVLCTASSDNVSSAQVKLKFKPKKGDILREPLPYKECRHMHFNLFMRRAQAIERPGPCAKFNRF